MTIKLLIISGLAVVLCLGQEKTAADFPPDTVVAVVNGKKMTAAELRAMTSGLPANVLKAFQDDPKQFLQEHAWYRLHQASAEKAGLHTQSPWKEYLEFGRMMTLVQADLNHGFLQISVSPEKQKAHYEANASKYQEVKAKLIYIPFSTSEDEAKAKATKAVQQARGGVDFVKLVEEYSQDAASKAQKGDLGIPVRSTTTQIPENMRTAILALKTGQVSEPLRHENGYYVFRAESAGVLPYEQVKDEIYKELKDAGFNEWKDKVKAESSVQFENEAFFQSIKQQPQPKAPGQ